MPRPTPPHQQHHLPRPSGWVPAQPSNVPSSHRDVGRHTTAPRAKVRHMRMHGSQVAPQANPAPSMTSPRSAARSGISHPSANRPRRQLACAHRRGANAHGTTRGPGPALPGLYIPPSDLLRAAKTIYSPDPIPLAAGCLSSVLLTNHTWRTAVLRPDLPHWSRCNQVLFMALAPLDPYAEADLSVTTLPPLCRRKRG